MFATNLSEQLICCPFFARFRDYSHQPVNRPKHERAESLPYGVVIFTHDVAVAVRNGGRRSGRANEISDLACHRLPKAVHSSLGNKERSHSRKLAGHRSVSMFHKPVSRPRHVDIQEMPPAFYKQHWCRMKLGQPILSVPCWHGQLTMHVTISFT